jgi:hypothetical protein
MDPKGLRVYPRAEVKGEVVATLEADGGVPIRAVVKDLSRGGMGLVSRVGLPVGVEFVVKVALGAKGMRARCRVANCRGNGCGGFLVGVQFVELGDARERERHVREIRGKLEKALDEG